MHEIADSSKRASPLVEKLRWTVPLTLLAFGALGTQNVTVSLEIHNRFDTPVRVTVTNSDSQVSKAVVPAGQSRVVYFRSTGGCENISAQGTNLEIECVDIEQRGAGNPVLSLHEDQILEKLKRSTTRGFTWTLTVGPTPAD
ncbi:hypothetical protein ACFL6C_09295 [Myxococcota bacterium]